MKTVNFKDLTGVKFNGGTSYRSVLKQDGLGFALMKTVINKGGGYKWHYQNHKEACTCISGKGYLIDLTTNQRHEIIEGVTYLVDNYQPHIFFAETDIILISVFNPPLNGNETHDENGNYNL